ncbi:MAG: outer membrane protein assembly factor BamB family protein [Planctomycetota bacterium]|jgi:outer membrane protein assembly factor BamB
MPTRSAAAAAACALVLLASPDARAANWPNWRGPDSNGASPERGLPVEFSPTRNVKWAAPLPGPGSATPVVWGDRVFLSSTDRRTKGLVAMCLSARDGRVLWRKETGRDRPGDRNINMAAPSPVTDGSAVWFLYGTGDLVAFDVDGRELWKRDLVEDLGCFAVKFGYSASPLLHDGRLHIVLLQREKPYPYSRVAKRRPKMPLESYLLALDAKSGKEVWRHVRETDSKDESRENYATPMLLGGGRKREIVIVGGECVTGHDPAGGAEVWRWEFPRKRRTWQRVIPTPATDGKRLFVVKARGEEMFALKAGLRGRDPEGAVEWVFKRPNPDVSTPLVYRGHLFVLSGDRKIITCLDPATGKQKGQRAMSGKAVFRASPTGVDGRIYMINEEGDVWVLSADPALEVLHRTGFKERRCQSTIAVSGGRLFVRTPEKLYCIGR